MTSIKGPAIDPESFRVEGHCCGIRLPALQELTGDGIQFQFSPETKAELVVAGVLRADDAKVANPLSAARSDAGLVPALARVDDTDDQQHDRHLDQHPDHGGERGA